MEFNFQLDSSGDLLILKCDMYNLSERLKTTFKHLLLMSRAHIEYGHNGKQIVIWCISI